MRRTGALLSALLLTACGGGGGGSHAAVPSLPQTTAKGLGNIQFSVIVPTHSTVQAKGRSPKFVSPNTKSVAISVGGATTNIDVVGGSPGCNTDYTQSSIVELPVNQEPRGMLKGPDGNIWFVEDAGGAIGKVAPGLVYTDNYTGRLQNGIILGPDGTFWITDPFSATIGSMTTGGGYIEFSGFPTDMQYLVQAADHTVWGTAYTEAPMNAVYHIGSDGAWLSGDTITTRANASWPALGPDNAIYVTENDGTNGWLARIAKSGSTWSLTNEFPMPGPVIAITNGPDGALWTGDSNGNVYRVTTSGNVTNTYHTSGFSEDMITGADGALWFAEYGTGKIGRMTTSGAVNEYTVPTANSMPYGIAFGSDGVYFTERNANQIGRINFPVACTATASVPMGTSSATLTAYDATGGASGSGNKLSTQTVPVSIVANATNTVNFVLNGIVQSIAITTGLNFAGCTSSGSIPLTFEALDASGAAIIGPGIYSDASGNLLTFTLTTTDHSGEVTFANGVITAPPTTQPAINWSGGTLNNQTIGATVSGGSIAGSVTTALVQGCS